MRQPKLRLDGTGGPDARLSARALRDDDAGGFRADVPGDWRRPVRPRAAWVGSLVPEAGGTDAPAGAVPGGRQRASGTGRSDGRDVGEACSGGGGFVPGARLRFDTPVRDGGYLWWYLDGLSDDGLHGITIIGFVGSVFSPYYAWARGRADGRAAPENHVALNVALYGHRRAWTMTERGTAALARSAGQLTVGPSSMTWDGTALTVAFDERCCPLPWRVRGTVRLIPDALGTETFMLDAAGRHRWTPLGPQSRIEVTLANPALRWAGRGYLDSNIGDEPIERGFSRWDWSRVSAAEETAILYDATRRDGTRLALALAVRPDGTLERRQMPPPAPLPRTRIWRIARATHGDAASVAATLEDTPFYARSVITGRLFGRNATAVHESLDLNRFTSRWVQALLPFRMPRRV